MRQLTIGEKIKYFRKTNGLSQLELELELKTSPGRISRIESGKVKATRETILKIAKVLQLNDYQLDYLDGPNSKPLSDEEISKVVDEIKDYFTKTNYFAYLSDDRWKIHALSISFIQLLGLNEDQLNNMRGKTIIEVMLNPELAITRLFEESSYEKLIYFQLSRFYEEAAFITDDPEIVAAIRVIEKIKIAKNIWSKIIKQKDGLINPNIDTRKVRLIIQGNIYDYNYSHDSLPKNPRFELVEYTL
jgi:transcriptional regulator with XRE-family HTH domain